MVTFAKTESHHTPNPNQRVRNSQEWRRIFRYLEPLNRSDITTKNTKDTDRQAYVPENTRDEQNPLMINRCTTEACHNPETDRKDDVTSPTQRHCIEVGGTNSTKCEKLKGAGEIWLVRLNSNQERKDSANH